jgi:hypothetical protein
MSTELEEPSMSKFEQKMNRIAAAILENFLHGETVTPPPRRRGSRVRGR